MDLVVPTPRIAPRSSRTKVGHFVDDVGYDGFAHYLEIYRAGMAALPGFGESFDVATAFGSVRVYRFDGPQTGHPVVLLPGRNAATPMWHANLPALTRHRTVYAVDLLGEPGLSVQRAPLTGPGDQAQWVDEMLAGLELTAAHLLGVSIGGWSAVNHAVRRPGRVASLTLLDPVQTFARIPLRTMVISAAMVSPAVPEAARRRVLRWISGGQDPAPGEALVSALISAGSVDFVLRQPVPKRFTDDQLRSLDVPVLAFLAGRSVMLDAERAATKARKVVRHGQIELWADASHAINGEYPEEIAARAHRFWDEIDA